MPLTQLILLVAGLLTGVTFAVDSYVDSTAPPSGAPRLVEDCSGDVVETPAETLLLRDAT